MNLLMGCALCLVLGNGAAGADAPISVRLESTKSEYALGEPVLLEVIVKNITDQDFDVWIDDLRFAQVGIFIAAKGDEFQHFVGELILFGGRDVGPMFVPLKPDESKRYSFRVLYTPPSPKREPWYPVRVGSARAPWHLAFEKPGTYRVKAEYLFPIPDLRTVESDRIDVEIEQPEGNDARLWEELNSPELLHLLQGRMRLEDQRRGAPIVAKALRLYQGPRSSYHPALEHVLKGIYQARRQQVLDELRFLSTWRRALAIEEPLPMLLNPKIWVKRTRPEDS